MAEAAMPRLIHFHNFGWFVLLWDIAVRCAREISQYTHQFSFTDFVFLDRYRSDQQDVFETVHIFILLATNVGRRCRPQSPYPFPSQSATPPRHSSGTADLPARR